jgi:hypothetical protein
MRLLCPILAAFLATAAYADVVTLKSGRVINGTYLGGTPRQIKVEVGDQIELFDVQDVSRIEFGAPSMSSNQDTRRSNPPMDNDRPVMRRSDADAGQIDRRADRAPAPIMRPDAEPSAAEPAPPPPPPPPAPQGDAAAVQLPTGTNLVVRMIDGIDSEKDGVGKTFMASLDEPVMINGDTVIPRGADATVKLVDSKDSGTFTGRTQLTLSLQSVKVNGRLVDINTQSVTRESDSRGQKTARNTTVGAVAGTIIGAIAGGGKGAAIGAGAGAAAGAGSQVITKGEKVKIPSETRLTFILDNPVTI